MSTREGPTPTRTPRQLLSPPDLRQVDRRSWLQFFQFCIVGGSGYIVNLAVFTALITWQSWHHLWAATAAFAVAWTSNFVLNKLWTFRRRGSDQQLTAIQQGWRNLTVSLLGLAINLIILQLLVTVGLPKTPAQAIAILLVTPVTFLGNRRWSFQ